MNIDEMSAGREMDVLIFDQLVGEFATDKDIPHYSTDIAAAWKVVENITEKHWKFKLRRLPGKDYMASFQNLQKAEKNGESLPNKSAPLAISRAALKVLGV